MQTINAITRVRRPLEKGTRAFYCRALWSDLCWEALIEFPIERKMILPINSGINPEWWEISASGLSIRITWSLSTRSRGNWFYFSNEYNHRWIPSIIPDGAWRLTRKKKSSITRIIHWREARIGAGDFRTSGMPRVCMIRTSRGKLRLSE
jgi:hypothetical protein